MTAMDVLLPVIDEYSQPFWDGALVGELRIQSCGGCGKLRFPPRPMCPSCQSLESSWRTMSGRGTIYSFVLPHPPLLPAYAEVAPYNVALVELEEDPLIRLVGNVVADTDAPINSVDASRLQIGLPVHAVFPVVADGVALLRWVLDKPSDSPGERAER
jgi:hypothetical protein